MKVLLACEESQRVCIEFRKLGHEAYSCDILPCSGGHPEWHLQTNLQEILNDEWDLIIGFPPCTYLTVSGNRHFNVEKYGDKARERHKKRELALEFFMSIANAPAKKIAIENPQGIVSTRYRKPDQIIQPYWFGDRAEKRTCLWLKNLPKLKPTNVLERPIRVDGSCLWERNIACKYPAKIRAKLRSKTFPGIAKAMAEQWGNSK